jgi:hypothetical protein
LVQHEQYHRRQAAAVDHVVEDVTATSASVDTHPAAAKRERRVGL